MPAHGAARPPGSPGPAGEKVEQTGRHLDALDSVMRPLGPRPSRRPGPPAGRIGRSVSVATASASIAATRTAGDGSARQPATPLDRHRFAEVPIAARPAIAQALQAAHEVVDDRGRPRVGPSAAKRQATAARTSDRDRRSGRRRQQGLDRRRGSSARAPIALIAAARTPRPDPSRRPRPSPTADAQPAKRFERGGPDAWIDVVVDGPMASARPVPPTSAEQVGGHPPHARIVRRIAPIRCRSRWVLGQSTVRPPSSTCSPRPARRLSRTLAP